jgi:hypothetical protein
VKRNQPLTTDHMKCRVYHGEIEWDFCQSNRVRKHDPKFEEFIRQKISEIWVPSKRLATSSEDFAKGLLHPILRSTTARMYLYLYRSCLRGDEYSTTDGAWKKLVNDYEEWLRAENTIEFKKAG